MAPAQKPGRSKQDYSTPPAFLQAFKARLNIFDFALDLAASDENYICKPYFTEEIDSLKQSWYPESGKGWAWCNPPFANIKPWVMKAEWEARLGAQIAMLVPAGVGANWWRDWVHDKAHVLLLNGRLTFVGETAPYPKDCAILLYTSYCKGGYECWNWRVE